MQNMQRDPDYYIRTLSSSTRDWYNILRDRVLEAEPGPDADVWRGFVPVECPIPGCALRCKATLYKDGMTFYETSYDTSAGPGCPHKSDLLLSGGVWIGDLSVFTQLESLHARATSHRSPRIVLPASLKTLTIEMFDNRRISLDLRRTARDLMHAAVKARGVTTLTIDFRNMQYLGWREAEVMSEIENLIPHLPALRRLCLFGPLGTRGPTFRVPPTIEWLEFGGGLRVNPWVPPCYPRRLVVHCDTSIEALDEQSLSRVVDLTLPGKWAVANLGMVSEFLRCMPCLEVFRWGSGAVVWDLMVQLGTAPRIRRVFLATPDPDLNWMCTRLNIALEKAGLSSVTLDALGLADVPPEAAARLLPDRAVAYCRLLAQPRMTLRERCLNLLAARSFDPAYNHSTRLPRHLLDEIDKHAGRSFESDEAD